jgi:hypothetical protein
MEFLLGVVFSFLAILFTRKFILTESLMKETAIGSVVYRQSHIKLLTQAAENYLFSVPPIATQSRKILEKSQTRIVFSEDRAYWIKNNMFLHAELVNGEIDDSTTKVVDTIAMDRVELDKMAFIVQKLTEGTTNDGGNPGL